MMMTVVFVFAMIAGLCGVTMTRINAEQSYRARVHTRVENTRFADE